MCGEHNGWKDKAALYLGSSPHVRGARAGRLCGVPRSGIIPACAGSTPTATRPSREPRDHPRMCGEHFTTTGSPYCSSGSSPHVRGARQSRSLINLSLGIIPACAGSTPRHGSSPACRRDHPRMCGEHTKELAIGECTVGSSPHVRGARLTLSTQPPATGIIPACAGSTPLLARIRPIQQGSSPHVRGAPVYVSWASSSSGIIPACAGSTSTARKSH